MILPRLVGCLVSLTPLWIPSGAFAQNRSAIDAAFEKFLAAASPEAASRLAGDIEKAGVSFDDAVERLKQGRAYTAQNPGVFQLKNRTADGTEHYYSVNIPPAYDPGRRYQVRFQLHGGIGARTDNRPRGSGEIGALAGAEQIYVLPYGWEQAPWWGDDQVLNLSTIVDTLKRTYNVDENRVVVAGVSDGATGAYYIAMRDTTPYASFLPLNGFLLVLANDEIEDGRIFLNNLRDKPLFVVNGGLDRLYPTDIVEPFTLHLMRGGAAIDYHPQPEGEHNTKWWPEVEPLFEKFVADHPRDPDPERLTWEAADLKHNRAHWLVIDQYGVAGGEAKSLPDLNLIQRGEDTGAAEGPMFRQSKNAGRVDLVRSGNRVEATTIGVTAFTLLLSPDKFDFTRPILVVANGREVFHERLERSVKTLLKWAARDNDRTMLYAAELPIRLAR
jgi:hypothetical protein